MGISYNQEIMSSNLLHAGTFFLWNNEWTICFKIYNIFSEGPRFDPGLWLFDSKGPRFDPG